MDNNYINNTCTKLNTLCFYFENWGFGGTERVLSILLPELSKKFNVFLLTGKGEGFELPKSVNHTQIDISYQDKIDGKLEEKILSFCLSISADVFIAQPNISIYLLKLYKSIGEAGIKTIAYNHEHYFRPYQDGNFEVIPDRNKYLENANIVTWLTNYYNDVYSIENSNGVVMPNPLPFDTCFEKKELNNNFIAVGSFINDFKRIDLIIEVFSKIVKQKKEAELYIIGQSYKEQINLLIKKYSINSKNVHIVGVVNNIAEYYKKSSILLMTSETEGFPMVLLEAGSFGIPSIILRINGLEDVITDGKNGFILERDNIDEMANKAIGLLDDSDLYFCMSKNSLDMSRRFTKDKICKRWEELLKILLDVNNQDELNDRLKKEFSNNRQEQLNKIFFKKVLKDYNNIFVEKILKSKQINANSGSMNFNENFSFSYHFISLLKIVFSYPLNLYRFIRNYNLIKKSDLFDRDWYLEQNEDVRKLKIDPIKHYLNVGWKEGRNPSLKFDGNKYLINRPDLKAVNMCPLIHYLMKL